MFEILKQTCKNCFSQLNMINTFGVEQLKSVFIFLFLRVYISKKSYNNSGCHFLGFSVPQLSIKLEWTNSKAKGRWFLQCPDTPRVKYAGLWASVFLRNTRFLSSSSQPWNPGMMWRMRLGGPSVLLLMIRSLMLILKTQAHSNRHRPGRASGSVWPVTQRCSEASRRTRFPQENSSGFWVHPFSSKQCSCLADLSKKKHWFLLIEIKAFHKSLSWLSHGTRKIDIFHLMAKIQNTRQSNQRSNMKTWQII